MYDTDFDSLYTIADDQAGYFTAAQAYDAGYSYERLSDLTSRGKFERTQHGIYRLLHYPSSRFEDLFIAQLRGGLASIISHDSALAVYELSDHMPSKVHLIIPRTGSRRREGIQLHTNKLREDEITMWEGLRITTPARTIADVIFSGLDQKLVCQAVEDALHRGLTTRDKFIQQAERRRGRVAETINKFIKGRKV